MHIGESIVETPISIAWQASDLSLLPTTRDDTATRSNSRISHASHPASTAEHSKSESGSRLSVSAAAGIGVGVTSGVAMLLVALLWCMKRYRRQCKSSRQAHTMGGREALREIQPESPVEPSPPGKENVRGPSKPQLPDLREVESGRRLELE